jgi:hypothetical protein
MDSGLPATAGDLTPVWLSAALGRRVTAVTARPLRQARAFSGGTLVRLDLTGPDAPPRLVAKLAPADPAMRARLAAANAREVAFYTGVAPDTPHVVQAAHAAADGMGGSVILLPDLPCHRAHPLVAGASPQVARAALRSLAAIHARWWGAPPMPRPDLAAEFGFAAHWPAFRAARPDLPAGLMALGDRMARVKAPAPDAPATLVHADAHLENLLMAPDGAAVWLDWQMTGAGPGVADVCYFLTSSLDPAARRVGERDLVALWHAGLMSRGVTGYPADQAWRDYRQALAAKLALTVIATAGLDNRGPARAAYRRADLARLVAFAADHLDDEGHPKAP